MVLDAMFIQWKQHVGFIHLENFESPVGFSKQISFVTKIRFFSFQLFMEKDNHFLYGFFFLFEEISITHTNKNRTKIEMDFENWWLLDQFDFRFIQIPSRATQLQATQIPLTNFNFCDSIVNCSDYNWTHDLINDCLYSGHLNLVTKGQKNEI